jgi:transcriptional regulator with XRE-family HTH domain
MGLAALRQAAELTQVELARRMGVTQAAISRMEQPHDLLLSTLDSYLQAIGGTARMIVSFADCHETTVDTSPSWHSYPSGALLQRRRGLLADVRVSVMLYLLFVVLVVVAVLRSLEGQSRPPDAEVERVHAADAGAWQRLGPVAFVFVLGFPDIHDDFAVAADAAAGGEFVQQPLVA